MVKAKDTIMSKELQEVYGCILPQHIAGLEWQAEISYKAGRKKVVDYIKKTAPGAYLMRKDWQNFLKENGLDHD